MLNIALRAAAAETTQHVLASVLASVVPCALVHIFTLQSTGVQREALLTLTRETAGGVEAGCSGSTRIRLVVTLVVIDACCLVLSKSRGTLAGEASNGVHTEELAVVLLGGALIQVFAGLSIWLQDVPSRARAQVTAFCVLTQEVTRLGGLRTFVQISAGGAAEIVSVAHIAVAAEGTHAVNTLAILTQVGHNLTLIDISAIGSVARSVWTHLLVLHGARQGAELALWSPATASVTAALGFGNAVAVGGRLLAHGL